MHHRLYIYLLIIVLGVYSCGPRPEERKETVREDNLIGYTIKSTIPHDQNAFTQGLVIHDGKIFESTGRDNSYLASMDLASGELIKKIDLEKEYFGEGITILNNKLYQLTWTTNIGFIYDPASLKRIGTFHYDTEGWGLTNDGTHLIMSDGSNRLYYLDPVNFEKRKTLHIQENNIPVKNLNEMEYQNGFIYANQWESNYIYKINPKTEQVVGKVNLTSLANEIKRKHPDADVLNGIAYNKETGDFLITGKLWPRSYWIRLEE